MTAANPRMRLAIRSNPRSSLFAGLCDRVIQRFEPQMTAQYKPISRTSKEYICLHVIRTSKRLSLETDETGTERDQLLNS